MPPKKKKNRTSVSQDEGRSSRPPAFQKNIYCFYSAPGPKYKLKPVVGYEDHCHSKYRNPAYSIAAKRRPMELIVPSGPGPKYLPEYHRAPGFTIGMPFKRQLFESSTPGPYYIDSPTPGPAFSMGWRTKIREYGDESAGPYDIPRDLNGPAFTIGKVLPHREEIREGPLPRLTNVDFTTPRSPAFSLSFRHREPDLSNATPGPYDPVDLKKGPAFSFGVKHHPCLQPYITPCDKMF